MIINLLTNKKPTSKFCETILFKDKTLFHTSLSITSLLLLFFWKETIELLLRVDLN